MHLYFIRHGLYESTSTNRNLRGEYDPPLSSTGRQQAEKVARRLKENPVAALYTSDFARALETAERLQAHIQCEWSVQPLLREIFSSSPVEAKRQQLIALTDWLRHLPLQHNHVVLVTHGNLIRLIADTLLDTNDQKRSTELGPVGEGSIMVIEMEEERVRLHTYNDTSHLAE
ncbi:histidine phosphatase family protein [Paenibacillus sp. HJGM_3]|uniref:histidine phosphatase family protein n=1 Tax=Paenibacillus sp. HJGM_3 TaxID=3379816 RepID=UPI00385CDC40